MGNPKYDRTHPMYASLNYMSNEEYEDWAQERILEAIQAADEDREDSSSHEDVADALDLLMRKLKCNPPHARLRVRRQAFDEGHFCYTAGAVIEANPHHPGKSKARWRWWREGWLVAQRLGVKRRVVTKDEHDDWVKEYHRRQKLRANSQGTEQASDVASASL